MNYTKAIWIFIAGLIIIVILHYLHAISLWWVLLPVAFIKTSIILGSANINSNFFTKVICSAQTDKKEIAITFDDGPNQEFTTDILKTLDTYNAKATFFVIGKNIEGNEDIIKKMDANGHTIGNHTYSHSTLIDFKNTQSFIEEIKKTTSLITEITGKNMRLFRPPYGVTTPAIAKAIKKLQYDIIGWNIRSLDTTKDNEKIITERVIQQIQPGAIVLFHDSSLKTNRVLKNLLEHVRQNGFSIVPLKELLHINAYN